MHLTDEQREVGRANFNNAFGVARRDFLRGAIGAGLSLAGGMGPMAFGYGGAKDMPSPVRVGIIGTGDQGGVLIGAMQGAYHQVTAICDIRPSSIHRAFHGDWASPAAKAIRTGLTDTFDWKSEDEARRHVKVYDRYQELLKSDDIEAVIIALPLHLHEAVALEAIALGKHVYVETLFAKTVSQCKALARAARTQRKICAIGHHRHYSILYQTAAELLRQQTLGQVLSVNAQWLRGNLPGRDSWEQPLPGGEITSNGSVVDQIGLRLKRLQATLRQEKRPDRAEMLGRQIKQWAAWQKDAGVDAKKYGYQDRQLAGRTRTALEELCRWRLWNRTSGGLMGELGHHQLDATLIMLDALQGKAVQPLSVYATGGRQLFPHTREVNDHIHCVVQFAAAGYEPGAVGYRHPVTGYPEKEIPGYDDDPHRKISLIYSSANGNGLGSYGEQVKGTQGTLQMNRETEALLYKNSYSQPVTVSAVKDGTNLTQPTKLKLQYESKAPPEAGLAQAVGSDRPSRGYRETLEHWAWCIRHPAPENQPRCGPEQALRRAVVAIACQRATTLGDGFGGVVRFAPEWFDIDSDRAPELDIK